MENVTFSLYLMLFDAIQWASRAAYSVLLCDIMVLVISLYIAMRRDIEVLDLERSPHLTTVEDRDPASIGFLYFLPICLMSFGLCIVWLDV